MNKKILIIIALVVLAGGGAAAYLLTKKDSDKSSTDQTNGQNNTSNAPTFNPKATDTTSFVATFTSTSEGVTQTGTIEFDGKGNSKYSGEQDGQTYSLYTIGSEHISCQGDQCMKFSSPQTDSPVSTEEYSYSAEDFAAYRSGASYLGRQSCEAGTCNVWGVTDESGNEATILIDDDGRVNKVSSSSAGTTYEIVYVYKPVTITAPANVQTVPGL